MPGFEELRNCGNCIIKVIEIERHLNEYRSGGEGLSNNINRGVVKGGGKAQTSVLIRASASPVPSGPGSLPHQATFRC